MSATDALFWFAEAAMPTFRPTIAGLFLLDRTPDPAAVSALFADADAEIPRLRQRVVEAPAGLALPEWTPDEHFDLAYHVRRVSLPGGAPDELRALLDLCAQLLATPLDRQRPLWEAHWIEGLEGGRCACFLKVHHALVDGVGAIALLDALTRRGPEAPRRRRRRRAAPPPPDALERAAALVRDRVEGSVRLAARLAAAPLGALRRPTASLDAAARTLRGLRGLVADWTATPGPDPLAVPGSGLARRLDVHEVPLDRLRKIKAPLGVTLNDLVLAALAGALHDYHRERRVHADELSCLVPMNLRGRDERDALGNRVGMFRVALPVGEPRPAARLARIVAQTRAAKSDKRGAAAPLVGEVVALLPIPVLRWVARRSLGRVQVACTNVPGVPEVRWMAGARIESIHPFASVVEGTPLVMALLSYAGRMEIGIDTDPEAIPDPHRITELFEAALAALEALGAGAAEAR